MLTFALTRTGQGAGMAKYLAAQRVEEPRAVMSDRVARLLGIEREPTLGLEHFGHLLDGKRVDGGEIAGKHIGRNPIGGFGATWQPAKDVSIAWALYEPDIREAVFTSHREAINAGMAELAERIGRIKLGHANRGGTMPGQVGWIEIVHGASRRVDRDSAPDPQLHSHTMIVNAVLADSGKVGSLHTYRLHGQVRSLGATYQHTLADSLHRRGIEVDRGEDGITRLPMVPRELVAEFSQRTRKANEMAEEFARRYGTAVTAGLKRTAVQMSERSKVPGTVYRQDWQQRAEARSLASERHELRWSR